MLTSLQYRLLKKIAGAPQDDASCDGFGGLDKLRIHIGTDSLALFRDKTVIDFGCGNGSEAIAIARLGARRVLGIDNREHILAQARLLGTYKRR